MEHNILIPYDFSDYSYQVFQSVNNIVNRLNANIHLLHILPGDASDEMVKSSERLLKKIPDGLKINCEVVYTVQRGGISEKVLAYASGLRNPVIFISHTSGQFQVPNYTGPNAESIVATSPYPVFLLKKGLDFLKIKTILLSVDIEKQNSIKLNHAVFLSRFFNNALIRLVHIDYDLEEKDIKRLVARLEHFRAFFHKRDVSCYGEIVNVSSRSSDLKSKIAVEYAEQADAELMLIATNEENTTSNFRISDHAFYILSHFRNNIFSITPFVTGAGKLKLN